MVAIKNMRMPNNCAYCIFRVYGRCYITDKWIDNYNCPQIKDGGCPLVEAISKDQYEAKLKADMVAMLTELKKEIEEQSKIPNNNASAYDWDNGVYACYKVVQQKIYALKAESEDKEE